MKRLLLISLFLMGALISAPDVAAQARVLQFTVNDTRDDVDLLPGDGNCETQRRTCTLRAAIEEANASQDATTVTFQTDNLPFVITPQSALPTIGIKMTIDGLTNGACTLGLTKPAKLYVVLDGSNAGTADGLILGTGSADSKISGLVIGEFNNGIVIESNDAEIVCNHIGVDQAGTSAFGNDSSGILIDMSSERHVIGGSETMRNVISGNAGCCNNAGIEIKNGSNSLDISHNFIGLDATGQVAIPNYQGIYHDAGFAPNNQIQNNFISGNTGAGISIQSGSPTIRRNDIGLDRLEQAVPNSYGIYVDDGAGIPLIDDNVITGNSVYGVDIFASRPTLEDNYIGTLRGGNAVVGAQQIGIVVRAFAANCLSPDYEAANPTIGGANSGTGNSISGNSEWQVYYQSAQLRCVTTNSLRLYTAAAGGLLQNNLIGINLSGTIALGGGGVYVSTSSVAGNDVIADPETLIIRGNSIGSNSPTKPTLQVNCDLSQFCNPDGDFYTTAIHHQDITIEDNYIGTNSITTVTSRNQPAVHLVQAGSLTLQNNIIAVESAMATLLIDDLSDVSGTGGSALNVISGNQIGLRGNGSAEPNAATNGILLNDFSNNNTITGNTIAANGGNGVHLLGDNNTLSDNFIGTNAAGTVNAGGVVGLYLDDADGNSVSGNVIGFNETGVLLESADNNDFWGNSIGTDAAGALDLGNSGNGVLIAMNSLNNSIGGDASRAFNQIHNNGGHGVQIWDESGDASSNTTLHATTFYNNGQLAIELGEDGVTSNDAFDFDEGQNELQNYPRLLGISPSGSISGTLSSSPNSEFRIDVFNSFSCDESNHGEGETWYGSGIVDTVSNGNAQFSIAADPSVSGATLPYFSAIATNTSTGDTSEFSACIYDDAALRFIVNDTGDAANGTTDGVCDIGGVCTLREALLEANAADYPFTIAFDIAARNAVIAPVTLLPNITNQLMIDGFSQGSANGCSLDSSSLPSVGVTLDGAVLGNNGLTFEAGSSGSSLRGLSLVNFLEAVRVNSPVTQMAIYCNLIGVQADGSSPGANGRVGIRMLGDDNIIASNLIGHNNAGIVMNFADNNLFLGNAVGTDFAGSAEFGNLSSGISVEGDNNVFGDGAGIRPNLIKNNGNDGIRGSATSTILINSIANNSGRGIDLGVSGIQPNDDESDGIQNFPILRDQNVCSIDGSLYSSAQTMFRIDVYYTTSCDESSREAQGEHYFGTVTTTTDAVGDVIFSVPSHNDTTGYPYFVATATNLMTGNTSEFSACYEYQEGVPTRVGVSENAVDSIAITGQQWLLIGVLLGLVAVSLWAIWRRRYVLLVLIGLCALAAGVDQPTDVVAEASNSCTVIGDILTDGDAIEGDGGVLLGATTGTLSAETPVSVTRVVPTTPLVEDASVTRLSDYFAVSSAETIIANADGQFIIGVPVNARADTDHLAVAVLQKNVEITDSGDTGESWTVAPVSYDATTSLASFSLSQLKVDGLTFTLIEGSGFSPIPPPSPRSGTTLFEVQCGLYTFAPLCTASARNDYANEFAFAHADFVTTQQFAAPALKNTYTRFVTNGDSLLPEYDPLTTFYGVYLLDQAICSAQPGSFAGRYNPTTKALEVCIEGPAVTPNGIKIVRHELFHAIQFAYPEMEKSYHSDNFWVFEGTATAVMESSSPMQRTSYFAPYHKLFNPINKSDSLSAYFSQEFWIYHNQGSMGIASIKLLFQNYGADLEKVDDAMLGLDTRYWEWAKNHAYERTYDYSGGLAGACQPTINTPNVVGQLIDHTFDSNVSSVFREGAAVDPLTADLWKITVTRAADALVFGVILDDSTEASFQKFYRASDSNCTAAEEGYEALFENVVAGEAFYVLVAKAPHDGVEDAVIYDVTIVESGGEE